MPHIMALPAGHKDLSETVRQPQPLLSSAPPRPTFALSQDDRKEVSPGSVSLISLARGEDWVRLMTLLWYSWMSWTARAESRCAMAPTMFIRVWCRDPATRRQSAVLPPESS